MISFNKFVRNLNKFVSRESHNGCYFFRLFLFLFILSIWRCVRSPDNAINAENSVLVYFRVNLRDANSHRLNCLQTSKYVLTSPNSFKAPSNPKLPGIKLSAEALLTKAGYG